MKSKVISYIGVTLLLFGINIFMETPAKPEQQYVAPTPQVEHEFIGKNETAPQSESITNAVRLQEEEPSLKPQQQNVEVVKSNEVHLQNVPLIQQLPELDRGCEVTSLAMVLQYAGKDVDKMTLAEQIKKVPFRVGDEHGNPNEGQVGDIYSFSNSGYGVYHGPIFQLMQTYLGNRALDISGKDVSNVYESLQKGAPVWVITNATFAPLNAESFIVWETATGPVSITYREHSVVVVGYDEEHVYINDPLDEEQGKAINREKFEAAWIQMGSQAITYNERNE